MGLISIDNKKEDLTGIDLVDISSGDQIQTSL